MATHVLLSIPVLEDIVKFLQPRAQDFQERIRAFQGIPALYGLTNPSNDDYTTLGGLIPSPAPSGPVPGPGSVQTYSTPGPGRTTPAPPISMPTPPQLGGAMANNMQPNMRVRRGGISDAAGGSISSPGFHTSPAPITNSASPAAHSPPKAGKHNRPQRVGAVPKGRKQSKAANTPTPATEPASTPTPAASVSAPTPAASVGMVVPKRSFEESEGQTPQASVQPPAKRVKTEPSPPAAPQKPPTPPPQISATIDRADIRTAEDAKELLTETFKKAEEQETILQSQGQSSQELIQWLSQLISGSADAGPSSSTSASTLVALTSDVAETQLEGADVEFFDYTAYFDMAAVPELDKRATLSPESHNDATTTPPSQTSVPAQPGAKAGEKKTAVDGPPHTSVKVEEVHIGSSAESDLFMESFFQSSGFSFDGTVEQLEEPWAIA